MSKCPCGSNKNYQDCCRPYIDKEKNAETAECLMRARYSAYVTGEIDFIIESNHPDTREDIKKDEISQWSKAADWESLEIVNTENGKKSDSEGSVEFIAKYSIKETPQEHHEFASFKKEEDKWYFYDGQIVGAGTIKREGPKVGRNDPCPCGSGKKYKKCCLK